MLVTDQQLRFFVRPNTNEWRPAFGYVVTPSNEVYVAHCQRTLNVPMRSVYYYSAQEVLRAGYLEVSSFKELKSQIGEAVQAAHQSICDLRHILAE